MSRSLQQLCEQISNIQLPTAGWFNSSMPSGLVAEGGGSSASTIILRLKQNANQLRAAHAQADTTNLINLAHLVEADLAVLQTISVISAKEASRLINTLYDLVEGKK